MEKIKVNFYNKEFEINIEDNCFKISIENAKNVVKELSCDEIFDAINEGASISKKQIKERI